MPAQKFAVGEKVRLKPDTGRMAGRRGSFVIMRLLPEADSIPQYQVRSDLDGHVRVARETELTKL